MARPAKPNDVFEGLLTKLEVMGYPDEGQKAKDAIGDFQAPYEILGVFTSRTNYNPVSDYLATARLDESARVILIPTPVGGFVYLRCDWDEEGRGNFIAHVLKGAAHVSTTA